ncbi:MAG: NUDIX hydrolase [Chromatiales bacterium]
MTEEVFAVVNDRDEVIDYRPRSEVHRLHLRHRATHVLVFNSRGDLLLQKRSPRKECSPGLWDSSAAGHVDRNESYDDCARRELQEELGLGSHVPLDPLFKIDACEDTGWEFCWVYRTGAEGPFAFSRDEIERLEWFSPSRLTRELAGQPWKFSTTIPLIWARLAPPLNTLT